MLGGGWDTVYDLPKSRFVSVGQQNDLTLSGRGSYLNLQACTDSSFISLAMEGGMYVFVLMTPVGAVPE